MKYKGHTIKKVHEDLGELDDRKNCIYEIYNADGEFIMNALTLAEAKELILNDYRVF